MGRSRVVAHDDGHARHALATDHPYLKLALAIGDDGGKATLWEVHVLDALVACGQHHADWKINRFKMGFEQAVVGTRETCQQAVRRH